MSVPAERVLPTRYDEWASRLTLGLEPLDAARGSRLGHAVQILIERAEPALARPRLVRHLSGLFVTVRHIEDSTTLTLRLCDLGEPTDPPGWRAETNRRRLVPRRLRLEIPPTGSDDALAAAQRVRRPALLPGTAYPISDAVTGLRGRVERAGAPARWARVEARRPGAPPDDPPVGRAHCDDRGEFLLLLGAAAAPLTTLERPFELDLVVYLPLPPVPMPSPAVQEKDGLWDLPVEPLLAAGEPDPVAAGAFPPLGWGAGAAPVRTELVYGRLIADRPPLSL